jgi:MFS family permease
VSVTDTLSWRWIFYVNLPVGGAALALIAIGLKKHTRCVTHRIDYTGAGLLTSGTVSLLLFLSWGGTAYPWLSLRVIGLASLAAIFYALWIVQEGEAPEPILPLRLFRNPVYAVSVSVIGLNAMALMGSLVFLPLFFQLVLGASPSHAGLMMAPMMGGVIVASVAGGRLVSATGRYKIFPIIGLAIGTGAFLTLAWSATHGAGVVLIETALIALGCGLGLVMPNLTTAIQNSVERSDLGVATSVSGFVRSLGGALGVAVAGAVVAFQLHRLLPAAWTQPVPGGHNLLELGVQQIGRMEPGQHDLLVSAYRHAIATTFLTGAGAAALAFSIVQFLPERPLRSAAKAEETSETAAY